MPSGFVYFSSSSVEVVPAVFAEHFGFVLVFAGGASCSVTHHADRDHRPLGEEGGGQDQRGRPYSRGLKVAQYFINSV